jgi:hypothetical protein
MFRHFLGIAVLSGAALTATTAYHDWEDLDAFKVRLKRGLCGFDKSLCSDLSY